MSIFLVGDSVTLTLVILLLMIVFYYVYNLRTNHIFLRLKIPGPTPVPLFGETLNIMKKGMNNNDTELIRKYGNVVGVFEGTAPVILVSDPELLRNILIKDSHIFINRRAMDVVSGLFEHGLMQLKDEPWKNARSIVSPTFSAAKLKAMFELMSEVSDVYNQRLLDYADKQETFDIKQLNSKYTIDNITTCLFGIETNSLQHDDVTLINHLRKLSGISLTNILIIIALISPRLSAYLSKRGYSVLPQESVNYASDIINQILTRRRQHLERRNDFIQIMVDHEEAVQQDEEQTDQSAADRAEKKGSQWGTLKKTLNDREVLAQAVVFMVAGYETSSILMSFFFYAKATEPAIQERVYEEIQREIGDEEVTYDKLSQLQYLDMAISETLRMYPPFIRFDRVASADYQLGEYRIPKGSIINVPVYPIHHDPNVWPDPEKFMPERFSSSEKSKRHPMTYLPFGDGPRNCIGMRFALLQAKLGIVKALRVVEIQRCEKTEVPVELGKLAVLSSKNSIWLRVVRRSA